MIEDKTINEALQWDFEKYESVILYLNSYYEKHMSPEEKTGLLSLRDDEDYLIKVTPEILVELDIEESFDEFCNEVQVMSEDMKMTDDESSLITLIRQDESALLTVDVFILRMIAQLMEGDEVMMDGEFFNDLEDW